MAALIAALLAAVFWTAYSVRYARRRYSPDRHALTCGLVAALGTTAAIIAVGVLFATSTPAFWWWAVPLLVIVLTATVLAERRRSERGQRV